MFEIREDSPTDGNGMHPLATGRPGGGLATRPGLQDAVPMYGHFTPAPPQRKLSARMFLRYKSSILLIFLVGCALAIPPV